MSTTGNIATIHGKIQLQAVLRLVTGLHIGASKDNAAIGDVDNIVIRDPLTRRPLIPGSSLKGKLRTLLAKAMSETPFLKEPNEDPAIVKRLFGASKPVKPSRLQFYDVFMTNDSAEHIKRMDTDLYLTEIKFENSIDRLTAVANPRQIERVPAGAEFDFRLVYNIEDAADLAADLAALTMGLKLLELDYLGGHGSRGYGRVKFGDFKLTIINIEGKQAAATPESVKKIFEGAGFNVVSAV